MSSGVQRHAPGGSGVRRSKVRTAEQSPAVPPSSRGQLNTVQTRTQPEPCPELLAEAQAAASRNSEIERLRHNNELLREELNRLLRAVSRKVSDGTRRPGESPQRQGQDQSAPSSRGQVSRGSGRSGDSTERDLEVLVSAVDTHREMWLGQHGDAEVQAVYDDVLAQRREAVRLRGYLRMQKDQMEVLQTVGRPPLARGNGAAVSPADLSLPPPIPTGPAQGDSRHATRQSAALRTGSAGGAAPGARQRAGYSTSAGSRR